MADTSSVVIRSIARKAKRVGKQNTKGWKRLQKDLYLKPAAAMLEKGSLKTFRLRAHELLWLYTRYRRNSPAIYHLMEVDQLHRLHGLVQRIRLLKGLQAKAQDPEFCALHPLLTNKGQCFQREKKLDLARQNVQTLLFGLHSSRWRGIGKFVF